MQPDTTYQTLKNKHKTGLYLLLLVFIIFGIIVEMRGALQTKRKTDAGVYFRAAWAIRTENDPYSITDDRGWHYLYPPLFAITMWPLADPPTGMDRTGYLPYETSIALWYIITLLFGFAGVHLLADALEKTSKDTNVRNQPKFCMRWWALRIIPILILLLPIGRTQVRGQIGLIISFILCGTTAYILYGKRFLAGLWLSAAIFIKIIPALFLLVPIWRRDWKMISGTLAGLIFGLLLIPSIIMGPQKLFQGYQSFYKETLMAGIKGDIEGSRGKELTGITSTDSNSPMVIIHNIINPESSTRPKTAKPFVRITHWIIFLIMILLTLLAAGWKNSDKFISGKIEATPRETLFLASIIPLMCTASPVFHPHYIAMALPLITIILSILWDSNSFPNISVRWKIIFALLIISHILTSIDEGIFLYFRDFGLVLLSTILLWAGSIALLKNTARTQS